MHETQTKSNILAFENKKKKGNHKHLPPYTLAIGLEKAGRKSAMESSENDLSLDSSSGKGYVTNGPDLTTPPGFSRPI